MRPTPPCKVNGKDCEKRKVGCHSTCPEYKKFCEAMKAEHKAMSDWYQKVYWKQDQVRSAKELRSLVRGRR